MVLRSSYLIACLSLAFVTSIVNAQAYDPLRIESSSKSKPLELTIRDQDRNRDIPLLVYLPESKKPSAVILFSHGLGGSRRGCSYLGRHWSDRGYVSVHMQHAGSDEHVWKDEPARKRMAALTKAASGEQYLARVKDVEAVIDQLKAWNNEPQHPLHKRLDLDRIGMSGHSFGAVTTQAVSGQAQGRLGQRFTDDRIDAALSLSPSSPKRGDPATAFASVDIPWMLMTGTLDTSPIGNADVESRLNVYPNLPKSIDKYELVLFEGQHSAFSDQRLALDKKKRNPNHHRVILALSTAFWDAHLSQDPRALEWLRGDEVKKLMEEKDRWQRTITEAKASKRDG